MAAESNTSLLNYTTVSLLEKSQTVKDVWVSKNARAGV